MFKFISAFIISTSFAFASETVLMDVSKADLGKHFDYVESQLFMEENGEFSGILRSVYTWETCSYSGGDLGSQSCTTHYSTVKSLKAKIAGMSLNDKEIVLTTDAGVVSCGVIKPGRIFKNTIRLILNGSCVLRERSEKVNGERRYKLVLVTK